MRIHGLDKVLSELISTSLSPLYLGDGATENEQTQAVETAQKYLNLEPGVRSSETVPIIRIKQGQEPLSFRGFFQVSVPPAYDVHMELIVSVGFCRTHTFTLSRVTKTGYSSSVFQNLCC